MKYTISFIFLILFIGCSNNNNNNSNNTCSNRFDFIASTDTIPVLKFDVKTPYYLARKDISDLYYNDDLCKHCSRIEFKIPFDIENKDGTLKVMTDYDYPYCQECPIPNRFREYYRINIYTKNRLYVEDKTISLDSLPSNIETYLQSIGKNKIAPESFSKVNYLIDWQQGVNQKFLDTILKKITKAHLKNVERLVNESNRDFCSLDKEELMKLKRKYPLQIEFDLGKSEKMHEIIYQNYKYKVENNSL
ncbi:hypothetical protein [Aquimarina sp. 2201CG5-10]|uniref:hypothetical protein n=1 Tax=Aquimarina callyspongiae TaxID=3098150 RepID=UPI002AB385BB|nr:hypothetical protein [Aquimarina sp. 2201CG5-10]MDY8134463.1 hypothetical protein [Aquimarina sp. 2201CG5-10]